MHLRARLSKKFHFKRERKMEWKMRLFHNTMGETLVAGASQKEGGQKRSIKCIKKEMKRTKCFHISLSSPFSYLFNHVFPTIQPTDKKKRTHKTPIHKIKPIPSLSWANCLLEVCWRFCVDKEIVYFFFTALRYCCLMPRVLQEAILHLPHAPSRNVLF